MLQTRLREAACVSGLSRSCSPGTRGVFFLHLEEGVEEHLIYLSGGGGVGRRRQKEEGRALPLGIFYDWFGAIYLGTRREEGDCKCDQSVYMHTSSANFPVTYKKDGG